MSDSGRGQEYTGDWRHEVKDEAIKRISVERKRQRSDHGYDYSHDDNHRAGELAEYAAYWAVPSGNAAERNLSPFCVGWDNKYSKARLEQLTIAGALIVAEMERLMRVDHQAWLDEMKGHG